MALHRLTQIVLGVPNVSEVAAYYRDFGLTPTGLGYGFATADGGEQLRLAPTARRRLLQLGVGADDADDLGRIAARLDALGIAAERTETTICARDAGSDVLVRVEILDRMAQLAPTSALYNGPGNAPRQGIRANGVLREEPVRPRKLGHVVLGSTDYEGTQRFFIDGLGFKVSDSVSGLATFLRCSSDHHNVLVQPAPVPYLHHTSWQVDDVDEIGRGATAMLAADPARHTWGLGRHFIGSNFFWYLRDPAGNFSEYYSDMDCIVDDALWQPGVWDASKALYTWGPPPPASFLAPEDLAALMSGSHARISS
jgi:catechol 2,3-dioxygenase-like lactoylglutathione lyase family enzyme